MAIIPVRGLAERGIVLDTPPADLAASAFSNGSNVRFLDGAARRSSVLRLTRQLALPDTRAAFSYAQSSGFDRLFVGDTNGSIFEVLENSGTLDVTPTGRTPSADNAQWTWATLGDVLYANRPGFPPTYFPGGGATEFAECPGWAADASARALTACRDQLFAVNLTKGVAAAPGNIAISDYALYGNPPATWDPLQPGVANEITLAGARGPLVGVADLDGTAIVYGERQCWRFSFTGDTSNAAQNLWVNDPLAIDLGLVSPNGVGYLRRRHFVFGVDDLYVHDGVSVQSVANERVRRWVFRNLDHSAADRCFVVVDTTTDEVIFAFPSTDGDAAYAATYGCNRAAVLNVRDSTWTLVDFRDVVSGDYGNFNPTLLWEDAPGTWPEMGGSWADLSDGYSRSVMFLAPRGSTSRILALDAASSGSVSFPAPADENPKAWVERVGYDLDEVGAPLNTWKIISSIFPQISTALDGSSVRLRVGAAAYPQGPYTWSPWRTFDPSDAYKVDFRLGGRYLGLRLEADEPIDFAFGGLDVDVKSGGRR